MVQNKYTTTTTATIVLCSNALCFPALFYSPVNLTGAPDHGYKIGFGAPVEFTGE